MVHSRSLVIFYCKSHCVSNMLCLLTLAQICLKIQCIRIHFLSMCPREFWQTHCLQSWPVWQHIAQKAIELKRKVWWSRWKCNRSHFCKKDCASYDCTLSALQCHLYWRILLKVVNEWVRHRHRFYFKDASQNQWLSLARAIQEHLTDDRH